MAHNPEVAGSNPAPATRKALETGPFVFRGEIVRANFCPTFARACLWVLSFETGEHCSARVVAGQVAPLRALARRRPQARVIRARSPVGWGLRGGSRAGAPAGGIGSLDDLDFAAGTGHVLPGCVRDAYPVVRLSAVCRRLLAARDGCEKAVATSLHGAAAAGRLGEPARFGAARCGARLAGRSRRVGAVVGGSFPPWTLARRGADLRAVAVRAGLPVRPPPPGLLRERSPGER